MYVLILCVFPFIAVHQVKGGFCSQGCKTSEYIQCCLNLPQSVFSAQWLENQAHPPKIVCVVCVWFLAEVFGWSLSPRRGLRVNAGPS